MTKLISTSFLFYCAWCLSLCTSAFAETYYSSIEHISTNEGLPETTVFSLAKDHDGFLWLGTPTQLIRYDGIDFISYSNSAENANRIVVSNAGNIFIDSKNRLWIGSWGEGIAVYTTDMTLLHHFSFDETEPNSLPNDYIQVIYEDNDGAIWLGTRAGGIALFNEQTQDFTRFQHDPSDPLSLSHDRVWNFAQDKDGALWVATSNGLNRLAKGSSQFERFLVSEQPNSLNHPLVRSLLIDDMGRLWVGTQIGLGIFDYDTQSYQPVDIPEGLSTLAVTKLKQHSDGNIYVASLQGMLLFEPHINEFSPLAGSQNFRLFPQHDLRDMLLDDSGLLWVATRFDGLFKVNLTPGQFQHINTYQSLDTQRRIGRVNALFRDSLGGIWVGTAGDVLNLDPKNNSVTRIAALAELVKKETVFGIAEDKDKNIWIGGTFGIAHYDVAKNAVTLRNDLLQNTEIPNVLSLLVDSHNHLWIGMAHSGVIFHDFVNPPRFYQRDENNPKSICDNTILTIVEDNNQQIWLGTQSGGVCVYNHANRSYEQVTLQNESSGIASRLINQIFQSDNGDMWFATAEGIYKLSYTNNRLTLYGNAQGLLSENIKGITQDKMGYIWVSSSGGISRLSPEQTTFENYSDRQLLGSNTFLPNKALSLNGGELVFGGINGLNVVKKQNKTLHSFIPKTVITDIWVDDQKLPASDLGNRKIELDYNTNRLDVAFSTLDFRKPEKTMHSYQLLGLSQEWRPLSAQRIASFTTLAPGDYQLVVKGKNIYNEWSTPTEPLTIVVTPAWWQKMWVQALFVLTGLLVIYSIYKFNIHRYRRQQKKLEGMVAARTEELLQTNEKLVTYQNELVEKEKLASLGQTVAGVAHELNTPLGIAITATTCIRESFADISKRFKEKRITNNQMMAFLENGETNLRSIERSLGRADELVENFKQLAIESRYEELSEFDLIAALQKVIDILVSTRTIPHHFNINAPGRLMVIASKSALEQIFVHLINNSLHHGFENIREGEIFIDIKDDNEVCEIIYRDNGLGIDTDLQKKIFEPFFTTKRSKGAGLGLHLVYNLITQVLKGSIKLDCEIDHGCSFIMRFPTRTSIHQAFSNSKE